MWLWRDLTYARAVTETLYSYLAPSAVQAPLGGPARLALATSTVGARERHPWFFSGTIMRGRVVAQALLVVAEVARTRYYMPPNMIAAVLRAADPVVTADGDQLRFESFSPCGGVYVRLDLGSELTGDGFRAHGTTNVDFNPPLRAALASLTGDEAIALDVGWDELRVTTPAHEVTERKVDLPDRWVKGFAEVALATAAMVPYASLGVVDARRFLRSLPRVRSREPFWAVAAGSGLRLAGRPDPRSVCVAAPERLVLLERLLSLADELRVFGPVAATPRLPEPSAWQLRLGGARLTIALSPAYNRGFSGEGGALSALDSVEPELVVRIAEIVDAGDVDPDRVAEQLGIARDVARRGLTVLAAAGRVGYDLETSRYFHRELPFDVEALAALNPRLRSARSLVEKKVVQAIGPHETLVIGPDADYVVRDGTDGWRCTCPWYARHRDSRGPCKHVLAAQALRRADA
jgi:SWIM zinc finger